MRQEVKALEDSDPRDQLATLVLRVVNELSPTTKASLIDYVERGNSTPEEAELSGGFAEDYIKGAATARRP